MRSWDRPWLRRLAAIAAALAVLGVLLVGVVASGWVSLDAERLREPVVTALTRALGRPVEVAGPARLALSFRPSLFVRDVRIGNPAGFPEPGFATIAELRLDTELLPLLRGRMIIHELHGRGVRVRLARSAGGRGNWIFEPAADSGTPSRFRTDWRRVVAEQAVLEFGAAEAPRSLQLETVVLEGLTGSPLRLTAQGQAEAQLPIRGEADSAPLADLAGPEPWPFTARLQTPQTAAEVSGTRKAQGDEPVLRLRFDAATGSLEEIGMLLGVSLPVGGAAELGGELEFTPGRTMLRELDGRIGGVAVAGELALDTRGPRPRVSGQLKVPELELASVTAPAPGDGETTLAAVYGAYREAALHFDRLSQFDADLDVTIGSLLNSPGDMREISAGIRVDAGRLVAPIRALIGGAAIEAEFRLDAAVPALGLQLAAHDAPMGGLALLLFDLPHVAGTVQRFGAEFSASGQTLAELVRDLEARIDIGNARLTYGNYEGGRPIGLHIAAAELAQPRGRTITAKLQGDLRGKAFEGLARADTVEHILRERETPFEFDGLSAGARVRLSGLLAEPGADRGPDIEIDLAAPQARELAPWLGFSSQSTAAINLAGRVHIREAGARLEAGSLVFGRSSIEGDLEWQRTADKLRVKASLAAGLLEPIELRGLRPVPAAGARRSLVDIPVLPERLDFGDLDLDLTVASVQGLALDVADVTFRGHLRDGAIEPSPLSLRLQGNELAGTLAVDARGPMPQASLTLLGDAFDAGAVLRRMRLAQDVDARVGTLRLQVDLQGSRLGEALERSSILASFRRGTLAYYDAGTRSSLDLGVAGGELRVEAGGPVTGSLTGTAADLPVRIELEAGPLHGLLGPAARWPFAISATLPDARWVVSGAAVPGREPATEVSVNLSGRRLSDLDTLLATALPPWGPYDFTGKLRFLPTEYRVEDARLAIGSSLLLGSVSLDTGARPPRLEAGLKAPIVQYDDFPLGDWSPLPASAGRMSVREARAAIASGVQSVHPLLSRERLALGDAQVEIGVDRLLAGDDELGRARFASRVIDGALMFGPIEIDGRAGRVDIAVGYEPRERDVVFSARATVDRLDYGMVAARFDPASEINGAVSIDLAIDSVAPDLPQLMNTASGHVDIAVWPELLRWGGFDLWAANLLRSLLPFFTPATSHLNCVIGHFDLDRGQLRSQALMIDTTNTRTTGWAEADFTTERLHMRFVPAHKRPRLFSLAIPVEVRGTFSDYRIALRPTDALGRVGQWFKTLVMVPLHWFGVGRIPRDGNDVCAEPSRG